ncbi:MAG: energy-coupling factor ABC transporter ATP-binding protein [Nocardioides sp.]|uniref:energy-coupling factor ABC transporter ATP-binding protein n=1 Tax=Nocardioides sp. TaxID=35761 RepID=UPI003EFEA0E2
MSRIELDRVVVTVPTAGDDLVVLHETSLVLTEQRVAFIGPNGSGKSTMARLLNGLVLPAAGRVLLDSDDVAADPRAARRKVGFCFTDPSAQLVMPTVLEDVALSFRRTHRAKSDRVAAAHEVLVRFGLDHLADRSVHALSGGQRQLLALAGVLATDPDLLVADEPTTLLDLTNTRKVAEVLFGLPQQLVLVTHDLELAARCDRALLIRDGRVEKDGPAADVVEHYRVTA